MIYFLGHTHAATHLREAAIKRGVPLANSVESADVVFISNDTPTDDEGNRDMSAIRSMVENVRESGKQIVLTSQVSPGFTRSLGIHNIFHQAETLRIKDAEERAFSPDYIAVGGDAELPLSYLDYLTAFKCPILRMSWEDAEMSKIAVNMMLAAQVDYTNKMAAACERVNANWENVARALHLDKRIGPEAYLTPGRWRDSKHLLRDYVTLSEIEFDAR